MSKTRWDMFLYFLTEIYLGIRFVIVEIVKTYSNEPSFFSSKRIERSILFASATSIICFYVWYKRATIGLTEVMGFVVLMGTWAGFNVKQLQSEKKLDVELTKKTDEPKQDN